MRLTLLITLILLCYISSYGQNQADKLKGFIIGNTAREKYIAYFNEQWIMTFSGEAYKIYFEVDRRPYWEAIGYIREFVIYRETFFGRKKGKLRSTI